MSKNNKIQSIKGIEKQEKSESGRSIVEMLGVLAVVGVLSIGGIAGYTYAMNKNKANDILDGVSKRAIVMSQQMIQGQEPSLAEYAGQNIGDYLVEGGSYEGDEYLWIDVKGVEQATCERIMNMEWRLPSGILVNDQPAVADNCQETDNTLTFDFAYDLGSKGCPAGYTGDNCQEHVTCENGGKWTPDGCVCKEGWYGLACDTDCDGFKDSSGVCQSCEEPQTKVASEEECLRCEGRELKIGNNGKNYCTTKECSEGYFEIESVGITACTTCSVANAVVATPESCSTCDNRYIDKNGKCAVIPDCGEHGYWDDEQNVCVCDEGWYGDVCDSNCDGFKDENGKCHGCDSGNVWKTSDSECNRCFDRVKEGSYCVNCKYGSPLGWSVSYIPTNTLEKCTEKGFLDGFVTFDTSYQYNVCGQYGRIADEEFCEKCADSYEDDPEINGCKIKDTAQCPDGAIKGNLGCWGCYDIGTITVENKEECDKCPNRAYNPYNRYCTYLECSENTPMWGLNSSDCYECSLHSHVIEDTCHRCEGYAHENDHNSYCFPCTHASSWKTTPESCARCGEQRFYDEASGRCILDCRTDEAPLLSSGGTCSECNKTLIVSAPKAACDRCGDERFYDEVGKVCVFDCRTDDAPLISWKGGASSCYACNTTAAVPTTKEVCDRCGEERYYDGTYCRLDCRTESKPLINGGSSSSSCYACNTTTAVQTTKEACDACDEERYYDGTYCRLDCQNADNGKPLESSDKTCYACNTTTQVATTKEACDKCGDERFYNEDSGKCILDCRTSTKPMMNSSGTCYECSTTTGLLVDKEDCDKCGDQRYYDEAIGRCVLATCSSDDAVRNKIGNCLSCSATGNLTNMTQENCATCRDKGTPRFTNSTGAICYLCSNKTVKVITDYCSMCDGTDYQRFVGTDERCYSCEYASEATSTAEECAKCGDKRTYNAETGTCSLAG